MKDSIQSPDLDAYFAVFKNDPQELLHSITQKMLETRFMDTFDISFFWDINMNLIKSNNFVPSFFVSNFDANRMRSMLVKVVHTLKDDTTRMQQVLKVRSSRITFDDLEFAILSLGKPFTYAIDRGMFKTVKDLYYTGNDQVNFAVKDGAPAVLISLTNAYKSISFRKYSKSDGFYLEASLDGSWTLIGESYQNFMHGNAIFRENGKEYIRRSSLSSILILFVAGLLILKSM